jgi:lipoate-protein ligase A
MGPVGRIIGMGAGDGAMNMGLDEALATLCRDRPVLRFYQWDPPAVSIGYFQRAAEIDLETCREKAIPLVRRPTGGRAVLHGHDLTYALILPMRPPWTDWSVAESYRRINVCLQHGLQRLGVPVTIGSAPGEPSAAPSPYCFSAVVQHELMVDGRKLIGSAQRRFPTALLQQGSILLDAKPPQVLAGLLGRGGPRRADLRGAVTSLRDALGRRPDRAEVEGAIAESLGSMLEIRFEHGALGSREFGMARALAETRYGSDAWTFRR